MQPSAAAAHLPAEGEKKRMEVVTVSKTSEEGQISSCTVRRGAGFCRLPGRWVAVGAVTRSICLCFLPVVTLTASVDCCCSSIPPLNQESQIHNSQIRTHKLAMWTTVKISSFPVQASWISLGQHVLCFHSAGKSQQSYTFSASPPVNSWTSTFHQRYG